VKSSPAARARRLILFVLGAVFLAIASGFIGSTFVKSPAQVAEEAAAPPRTILTAPAVRRVLTTSIVLRGTFTIGKSASFSPGSVAATQNNPGGGNLVVTGVFVHAGDQVNAGRVLAEASDRPIFVLPGQIPLWRDMVPGESGRDVMELQAGLADLGYSSGNDTYGIFGSGTEAAVKAFYAGIEYSPPMIPSPSSTAKKPQYEVIVPKSEAWFVPNLPAQVLGVGGGVGDQVSGALLTLVESGIQLTGQLEPTEKSLIRYGMKTVIYSDVTGYTGNGSVGSVGVQTAPSTANGGASFVPVQITPAAKSWPSSLNGQNVQITIIAASTGRPALAVPVAALSYDASGQAVITTSMNGSEKRMDVRVGASADGYVVVTPIVGSLAVGTQVVVG
jgi:peptidoglycan hydrolase-like protein with peptidoglycan-binding domain